MSLVPVRKTALLPCPFCGSEDIEYNNGHYVQDCGCRACGAIGPNNPRTKSAIERWNTRPATELSPPTGGDR